MVPRNYDINRNMYSSSMNGCTEENNYYYNNEVNSNCVDNNWECKLENNGNPWKREYGCNEAYSSNEEDSFLPKNDYGYYCEDDCDDCNDCNDEVEGVEEDLLLGYNEIQSTDLVTIRSSKPRVLAIKSTSCEACIDEVKLITTFYPDGTQKDKCIIQASLIFTILYYSECRGNNKSEVKFLIPFSDYILLPFSGGFDGNVKLEVEDAYAKSIDGTNLILSATILTSAYGQNEQ